MPFPFALFILLKKTFDTLKRFPFGDFQTMRRKKVFVNNLNDQELRRFLDIFVEHVQDDNNVSRKILAYLNWFLPNETEVTKFMKEKIMREEVLRHFVNDFNRRTVRNNTCGSLKARNAIETIDRLMEFCLSPEGIVELKKKIVKNIDQWQLALAGRYCWGRLDYLLKWALGHKTSVERRREIFSKKKKKKKIKKIFNKINWKIFFKNYYPLKIDKNV